MRAGPLSRDDVIETLNRYFVPVYTSIEDYNEKGSKPEEEKDAWYQIYRTALDENRSCGTVAGYVLAPDGTLVDSVVVTKIYPGDSLLNMLKGAAAKLGTKPGEPVVPPKPQNTPPAAEPGSLVLHLVARAENTDPETGGSWHSVPSENFVTFGKAEVAKLLPAGETAVGAGWELDKDVMAKLLVFVYPQSEDPYDKPDSRIESQSLKATVVEVKDGLVRARIDGTLRMHHNFYPGKNGDLVDATLVGFMDFEVAEKEVRAFQLATEKAAYGKTKFDAGVRGMTR